ncbi:MULTISPECIES: sigma-70 region 4 domain-containing protein [Sphingobium]|jgi:DNA-directed RNA polymerase specialized sigma24 family protein|uniref:sigma-70 region 4 domain-containing protein n=1 Tax=Sphingobium TaxID=165695 RepID=UPI000C5BC510|nr:MULTISPECIES: sigma-70 region 4 domain-containing protein [Sphingobium]MAX15786.1 iron dicitrate transport regulator FecR [Sphingobium sp.]MBS50809.1 iron dicitrate transport regulator FecR [Sphingobium sp.]MCC4257643.1 sigma-70 region 4 domain-containing protein [Sphingobium lactosutens]HCW61038.1 iron dicitrate transport regulator FecR [Sphingobium sp.]
MTDQLPLRVFRRRGHRALRRMTERQRAIFSAMRLEETSYPELAERHGISAEEVQAEFAAALKIFLRTLREPDPWWQRLWPW